MITMLLFPLLLAFMPHLHLQKARDECVATYGPEAEQCQVLIEAHKLCLRAEGFNVCVLAALLFTLFTY